MRRPITQDFYDAAVDAYRRFPGNHQAASEEIRNDPRSKGTCTWKTAKRAWDEGWPRYQMKPIKDVLNLEEISSRRLLEKEREKNEEQILVSIASDEALLKEKARQDAITARVSETLLVRAARDNVVELLANTKELLKGFQQVAPKVALFLETMEVNDQQQAERTAMLLWRIAISSRAAVESGWKALQMERLLLGQPTDIIGMKDVDNISDFDALKELEEAAKAAERVRERRKRREARRTKETDKEQ
jgi:hypothetical protein